jgi:hypothetical protein
LQSTGWPPAGLDGAALDEAGLLPAAPEEPPGELPSPDADDDAALVWPVSPAAVLLPALLLLWDPLSPLLQAAASMAGTSTAASAATHFLDLRTSSPLS